MLVFASDAFSLQWESGGDVWMLEDFTSAALGALKRSAAKLRP